MRRKFLFEYDMTFITILSVVLFIIPLIIVYGYCLLTRGMSLNFIDRYFVKVFSNDIDISRMVLTFVIFFVILFLWMVLHEIIHGIFYVRKGANKKNITYARRISTPPQSVRVRSRRRRGNAGTESVPPAASVVRASTSGAGVR